MREAILNILDEMGILIDDKEKDTDFDLSEYFVASVQFMTFLVEVEDYLGTDLPDDYLLFENYRSFNALCDAWEHIISETVNV